MIALLLALLVGTANALEVRPPSVAGSTITPSNVYATTSISLPGTVLTSTTSVFAGLVGMGTNTPESTATVKGTLRVYDATSVNNATIRLGNFASAWGEFNYEGNSTGYLKIKNHWSNAAADVVIENGNIGEVARFKGDGKVGIGTASPCSTCTLHVAGGASVTGAFAVSGATFTVANTGIVSAPSQVAASVDSASNLNTAAGAVTTLYWVNTRKNNNGFFGGSSSSSTFTVPAGAGGGYPTNCSVTFNASTAAEVLVRVTAGGQTRGCQGITSASTVITVSCPLFFDLAAGDTIKCEIYSPSAQTISGNTGDRFWAYKAY